METKRYFPLKRFIRNARPERFTMSESIATELADEQEDVQESAEAQQERLRKAEEIKAEMSQNELEPDQCDESNGRYNREFLYNIRDIEKLLCVTACPVDPEQLKALRVCPSVLNRLERWYERIEHRILRDDEWMALEEMKRDSERRKAIWKDLHRPDRPWKAIKISETEEDLYLKTDLLISRARAFFNKIAPATCESLTEDFLSCKMYNLSGVALRYKIIPIIIDLAIALPNLIKHLSEFCVRQIEDELKDTEGTRFRNALIVQIKERLFEKDAEITVKQWKKRQELNEIKKSFRMEKIRIVKFIGHLYLLGIHSIPFILNCINQLVPSTKYNAGTSINMISPMKIKKHISIECAVQLLKVAGKRLHEENLAAAAAGRQEAFPFDSLFATISKTMPVVGNRVREMIIHLEELHANEWANDTVAKADLGFEEQYGTAQAIDKDKQIRMLEIKLLDEMEKNSMLSKKLNERTLEADELKEEKRKFEKEWERLKEAYAESEKVEAAKDEVDLLKGEIIEVKEIESDAKTTKETLIDKVRDLFNKVTPTTYKSLIEEFLSYKVHESPHVNEIASLIFELSIENIEFSHLYTKLCYEQVKVELGTNDKNSSRFRNVLLVCVQKTFTNMKFQRESMDDEKNRGKEPLGVDERRIMRNLGTVTIIGFLYLDRVLSFRIIHFCVVYLLKPVTEKDDFSPIGDSDEQSLECAVQLLNVVGSRLHEENLAAATAGRQEAFPFDDTFATLRGAAPFVSDRVRLMITDLVELHGRGWEQKMEMN